ncbi:copper resistance CopC family protein [Rhizobium sp. SAFR-030]|uniref:copper resistance CopC family protein n=1 Tax=Rhizobium sp. SAFR-030 TaxID=3387277 RepID=UPI003F811C0E
MRNQSLSLLVIVLTLLGLASTASAHTLLVSSDPPDGSSLQASPATITIRFSEGLEPPFSHLTLKNQTGEDISLRGQSVIGDDGSLYTASPLKPLSPGSYEVCWDVLSKDGHKTSGSVSFQFSP